MLEFDIDKAESIIKEAIEAGLDPMDAANAQTEGIRVIGDKFSSGDLFLPDLVCASEVLKKAFPIINEAIKAEGKI